MSLSTSLSLFTLLVAVGASAMLYNRNDELKARIAHLEQAADAAPPSGPDAPAGSLSGAKTHTELAALRRRAEDLAERVEANASTIRAVAKAPPALPGDPKQANALVRSSAFSDAVREIVLDMAANDVAFRSKVGTGQRTKLPKDSAFTRLAEVLKLDATQEAKMSADLQAMQQDLFGLLSEERSDGVVPLEVIAKAEELPRGDPKRAELFVKLFTLKLPGGEEETYMQRAVKLQTEFRKTTAKYLRPQQLEIWRDLEVDLFSIKFE